MTCEPQPRVRESDWVLTWIGRAWAFSVSGRDRRPSRDFATMDQDSGKNSHHRLDSGHTGSMALNVFGDPLDSCSVDPLTGWFRDGSCRTDSVDGGSHTICGVMTPEFLDHQLSIGNDLVMPNPAYGFPGLVPGDRWCVTARNWLRAYHAGAACPVVLAATARDVLSILELNMLQQYAVDVPGDLRELT